MQFSKIGYGLFFCLIFLNLKSLQVGVFGGTNEDISNEVAEQVSLFGKYLNEKKLDLVIGDCDSGLLKIISDKYLYQSSNNRKFRVIQLKKYFNDSAVSKYKIFVKNLNQRMKLFNIYSDLFVIFPGGIGTLYELIYFLKLYPETKKRIILVNVDHFWDDIKAYLQKIKKRKNSKCVEMVDNLVIVDSVEACISECSKIINKLNEQK